MASSGFIVRKLGFSADGTEIWFNPGDGKPPMLMPSTGGTPRPFLAAGTNTPAWSPDGTRLVYVDKANRDDPMYVADRVRRRRARRSSGPGTLKNMNPVWSPDGQWIYFARGSEPQDETEMDVWRLRPSGGSPERVTTQHLAINFLAPLDPRTLLYVARAEDRSGPWLWSLDVESGMSTRVPSGVDQYTSVSASRDGRRIVATVANPSASLWRVPLLDRLAEERDAEPYALPEPTGMALAPRFGKDVVVLSVRARDGRRPLEGRGWKGVAGPERRRTARCPSRRRCRRTDATGRRRQEGGKRHLSIMSADGTNARTLAPSIEIEGAAGQGAADWSPDGTRIVTGGRDEKGPALFIIPVDTGVPVRLARGQWVNPVWSPRGDLIVYAGRSLIGQVELVACDRMARRSSCRRCSSARAAIASCPTARAGVPAAHSVAGLLAARFRDEDSLASSRGSAIRAPCGRSTSRLTGSHIVFDRSRQNSNIVLIELPPR